MPDGRKRLLYLVTEDWYFVSHRLALARAAREQGFEVTVATRLGRHRVDIEAAGIQAIPLGMDRRGLNPFSLLLEVIRVARIFRRVKPDIVHLVALRPIVVGGLAVRLAGVPNVVSAVAGMGFLFAEGDRLPGVRWVVQKTLPWLLSRGLTVVQNQEDGRLLVSFGLRRGRLRHIPGVGVDTDVFLPGGTQGAAPIVMMASRLLRDKGVAEFVEAARLLRASGARFVLVGEVDAANHTSITEEDLQNWVGEGVVEWWGRSYNMASTLVQADVVCLPSYSEGLPKVLLEAMACAKPCVATDVPGCRDAIAHEDNGLLVPAKNAAVLAAAFARLLDHPNERHAMGARGRARALNEFSQSRAIEATIGVYREILA